MQEVEQTGHVGIHRRKTVDWLERSDCSSLLPLQTEMLQRKHLSEGNNKQRKKKLIQVLHQSRTSDVGVGPGLTLSLGLLRVQHTANLNIIVFSRRKQYFQTESVHLFSRLPFAQFICVFVKLEIERKMTSCHRHAKTRL